MKFVGGDRLNTTVADWSPLLPGDRNPNKTFNFAIDFECNQDVDMQMGQNYLDTNDYTWHVEIQTKNGNRYKNSCLINIACPLVTLDEVSEFIGDHKIIFFIIGILVGSVEAVLGLRLFIPTLFVFGFVTGFFITMV
jgi:hypothetical protein